MNNRYFNFKNKFEADIRKSIDIVDSRIKGIKDIFLSKTDSFGQSENTDKYTIEQLLTYYDSMLLNVLYPLAKMIKYAREKEIIIGNRNIKASINAEMRRVLKTINAIHEIELEKMKLEKEKEDDGKE